MREKVTYINTRNQRGEIETIDEFSPTEHATREEYESYLLKMLTEYKKAFKQLEVFTSTEATDDWLNR